MLDHVRQHLERLTQRIPVPAHGGGIVEQEDEISVAEERVGAGDFGEGLSALFRRVGLQRGFPLERLLDGEEGGVVFEADGGVVGIVGGLGGAVAAVDGGGEGEEGLFDESRSGRGALGAFA